MAKEGILVRGRFKVIQVLRSEEEFAAVIAVDILEREKPLRLLNIYEGSGALRMAAAYQSIRHCPEFVTSMLDGDSLVAVFQKVDGTPIDKLFCVGEPIEWKVRLHYAKCLFDLALSVSDYPPEFSCATFYNENLLVRPTEENFGVRYILPPVKEELNGREMIFLLTDQMNKILLQRWETVESERLFMDKLNAGTWNNIVPLYSAWREVVPQIEQEYEKLHSGKAINKFFQLLKVHMRRDTGKEIV